MANLSSQTKYLLGCGTLAIIFTIGFLAFAAWSIYRGITEAETNFENQLPEEIRNAGVLKGADFLTRTEFFKLEKGSVLKNISRGASSSDEKEKSKQIEHETGKGIFNFSDMRICGNEIAAAAKHGGYVLDKTGKLQREILFEPTEQMMKVWWWKQPFYRGTTDNLKIVDLENDGKCEFTSHSSIDGLAVFNSEGNGLWRYGQKLKEIDIAKLFDKKDREKFLEEASVSEASALDIDGDGISEFIVFKRTEGVRLFDSNHQEKWLQPDEDATGNLKLIDIDDDKKSELIDVHGKSSEILDPNTGGILKKIDLNGSLEDLIESKDDTGKSTFHFLDIYQSKITVSNFIGKDLFVSDAPLSEIARQRSNAQTPKPTPIDLGNGIRVEPDRDASTTADNTESVYQPKAVWVKLRKDKPKYLAVIASFIGIPRSNLYVYEPNGTLVYHELLPEDAETILAVPAETGTDSFLVGGKLTIWKFEIKN